MPADFDPPTIDFEQLVQPHRVHRRLYTDPQIFGLEMTRVFAASWCYVGHESEIPEPGDYRTTTLGLRPVLMTRGRDGGINVLLNRCAHRGTVVAGEERGCAKRFVCPYHGWTYSPDGRLVAIPFPADHPAQDYSTLSLGRLEAASYRGFVFATLNADPEPLDCWLGEAREALDTIIDRHPGGEIAVMGSPQLLEFAGNWKLSWDNAADGLHATFAHHSYNTLGETVDVETVLARDPGSTPMVSKALRNGHMVVDQRPGIPQGPWATMRDVPFREPLESTLADAGAAELLDLATGSMLNLSLFPNLIFVGNQLLVVEPVAVDRTRLQLWLTSAPGAPPEIDLLRLRVDEDFVNFGTPDDLDMFERVQRGLSIPEMEWIDMSRGLPDDITADGSVYGPITSEAPQRRYLAHYAELMTTPAKTRASELRIEPGAERRTTFSERGAVVIPGLLDDGWCERLHAAIERCQASPSQFYGVLSPPGELKVDSDLFRWFDDGDIAEATHESSLPALGAELCGAEAAVLVEDQWFCSEPGAISRSPWHQDHPYYNLDRPFVTIWVTLDDVTADAALRVVEGSHATGITYAPIEFSSSIDTIGGDSELEPVPDVDADPERFPVTTWDLQAGDAVAIDSRMLHSTGIREVADRPFRRLSTRYAHPDTRYLDLGEQAAVFWKMLPHGLSTGDLVAGEVFPLIKP